MKEKHTPGPWFAGLDPHCPDLVHTAAPEGRWAGKLVGVGRAQPDGDFEEACANARLIAAAPELLEACEALLIEWEAMERVHGEHGGREVAMAKAAIAKAKGES